MIITAGSQTELQNIFDEFGGTDQLLAGQEITIRPKGPSTGVTITDLGNIVLLDGTVNFDGDDNKRLVVKWDNVNLKWFEVSRWPNHDNVISKATSFTCGEDESGATYAITGNDVVATLPSTKVGLRYRFHVRSIGGSTGFSLSPAAVDKLMGSGLAETDDLDAVNTQGTAVLGDQIEVLADGSLGWYVLDLIGTWAG
jgi:hypothetical protein